MMSDVQKTFLTGEFAALFEVKKDTLLYYDKIDLFKPAGVQENGYRYYTFEQFDHFMAIQSLRAVQFPIKQLKQYFTEPSQDKLQSLAVEQAEKVGEEIRKLQDIQSFLFRVIETTNELSSVKTGEVLFQELPEEPIVLSTSNPIDSNTPIEEISRIVGEFLKGIGIKGAAANGSILNKEQFLQRHYHQSDRLFCRMEGPDAVKKPAGLYAVMYQQGTYEEMETAYSRLLDQIEAEDMILDGDVFEEYLLHSLMSKNEADYMTKLSVKVRKREA
ncbi:DNA-binding transcriptional regulator, MerR family [Bacillus altitudinis]|uniref:MerR family transcriptional regulator n=1 Tax=Bacillus altitudinis TaxID=293387 RepID=UPI00091A31A5|nr:MerR family transcriptional regulator [Bacillus altitudinis]SFY17636.1 DNA-binding transcriptional regulator, MerR family [Bacillus altitudinis]SNS66684.1 DNA-binding transcriptional regulator, MerR family [Bacillus altitudinis]